MCCAIKVIWIPWGAACLSRRKMFAKKKYYVYCLGTTFHFDFCHLLKPVAPTVGRPTAKALDVFYYR